MEDIFSMLKNVGYNGTLTEKTFHDGIPNINFVNITTWLSEQLGIFCSIENVMSKFTDEDLSGNALEFLVEVSSLLKELGCPIKELITGPVEERLISADNKYLAIGYLCTELEAAKISATKNPKKDSSQIIELNESKTAKELRETLILLGFPKPPDNITPHKLFTELKKKLITLSHPLSPKEVVGTLLFSGGRLSEKQWYQLEKLYKEIYQEYENRRILLLTRLDVTIKSFLWSDKLKNKENVLNIYNKKKQTLKKEPSVKIADILSATADIAVIEKTSSSSVRKNTKCHVNTHVIGAVPDRGGRPEEQQPPPPEIPSWQKNDSSSRGGFRQQSFNQGGERGNYRGSGIQLPRDKYQNSGYSNRGREHGNVHIANNNYQPTVNYNSNHHPGNYNTQSCQPVYQNPQYGLQYTNQQLGFGGYTTPAGDNFHQYGAQESSNHYQSRHNNSGPRSRGNYNDRGNKSSRGYSRGRGRW